MKMSRGLQTITLSYFSSSMSVASLCLLFASFCGLFHHYIVELLHLNPYGIKHIAMFMVLCKGFVGIKPHFELYQHLFMVYL